MSCKIKVRKMTKHPTEKEAQEFDFSKYKLRQMKAMREKCLNCCGYQEQEVRGCEIKSCSLWPYRMCRGANVPTISLNQLRKNTQKEQKKELEHNE